MENPTEAVCTRCSSKFTFDGFALFGGLKWTQDVCDECIAKQQEEIRQEKAESERKSLLAEVERKWSIICPDRYIESDINHPTFRRGLHAQVMRWMPTREKPWLGIVGEKGCCKTRIALMRTRVEIENFPKASFLFVPIYQYAKAVRQQYDDGKDTRQAARDLLTSAIKADWLILDDIGKARNTPAVVEELFALLDHRHANNLETVWTANSSPAQFCEGISNDIAGPLVRRLTETSELFAVR